MPFSTFGVLPFGSMVESPDAFRVCSGSYKILGAGCGADTR